MIRFLWMKFSNYLRERLWLRPAAFGVLAVIGVILAGIADDTVDLPFISNVDADTIRGLLSILASAMLSVATFSVSVMLAAQVAAISASTPRAFTLVVADSRSQQAISTFIGAFVFSIIAIIALNLGYFERSGRTVLFVITIMLFVWVVGTLAFWIDHVARLATVQSTIAKVTDHTTRHLVLHMTQPGRGATPVHDQAGPPSGSVAVASPLAGTIIFIDTDALAEIADDHALSIHLDVRPGELVAYGAPLAHLKSDGTGRENEKEEAERLSSHHDRIARLIRIGTDRHECDDPVLAVRILSEIADRALSPGVNDPGTAMDIMDALLHAFDRAAREAAKTGEKPAAPRVYMPVVQPETILNAAFGQTARDGAAHVEVAEHLQRILATMQRSLPASWGNAIREQSDRALARAEGALTLPDDLDRVKKAAAQISRR